MTSELRPGEIGVAVVSEGDLVKGNEYEVLAVLDPGESFLSPPKKYTWEGKGRVYLAADPENYKLCVPVAWLRRRKPPAGDLDTIEQLTGWRPSPAKQFEDAGA